MHRWSYRAIGMVVLLIGIGCQSRYGDSSPSTSNVPSVDEGLPRTIEEIGSAAVPPAPYAPPPKSDAHRDDPIVVPLSHITVIDKRDIYSLVDGNVLFIGREGKPGEEVPPNRKVYKNPRLKNDKGVQRYFIELREGDRVEAGSVVVLLDEQHAVVEVKIAEASLEGAKKDVIAADKLTAHAEALHQVQLELRKKNATSNAEVIAAKAQVDRYDAEKLGKESGVTKADGDLERARIRLADHEIRSPIDGEISQIFRSNSGGVKASTDPIMQIQNLDRLRVEGFLDRQYDRSVTKGMPVLIEPTELLHPNVVFDAHSLGKSILALAVSSHPETPLILSGGEDRTVYVWDRNKKIRGTWVHPDTIKVIACTPPTAEGFNFALTGCLDGKARLWDISNADELPTKPMRELDGRHSGGVAAAAFSPNGEFVVTADEKDIYLWKVKDGKQLYRFPRQHRASISALHFTPQSRVISAGRDNQVLVWAVGSKGAIVEKARVWDPEQKGDLRLFEHRSGDVPMLGVTEDGNHMLLDQDKTSLRVIALRDHTPEATLYNQSGDSTKFSTFALFSPPIGAKGQRLLLTASSNEGVAQLWRMPTAEERGAELARLICKDLATATCAAFSPTANKGFIVIGTKRGEVQVWDMPTEAELNQRWQAKITYIDRGVEAGGKSIKIWAEFENKGVRQLRPGVPATIVIQPTAKP